MSHLVSSGDEVNTYIFNLLPEAVQNFALEKWILAHYLGQVKRRLWGLGESWLWLRYTPLGYIQRSKADLVSHIILVRRQAK